MNRDIALLKDIQNVILEIQKYGPRPVEQNIMQERATAYLIAVIGEAANNISASLQQANPQIPWREMIGMRHRLIHGYANIRTDLLWKVVEDELPKLLKEITTLLANA